MSGCMWPSSSHIELHEGGGHGSAHHWVYRPWPRPSTSVAQSRNMLTHLSLVSFLNQLTSNLSACCSPEPEWKPLISPFWATFFASNPSTISLSYSKPPSFVSSRFLQLPFYLDTFQLFLLKLFSLTLDLLFFMPLSCLCLCCSFLLGMFFPDISSCPNCTHSLGHTLIDNLWI